MQFPPKRPRPVPIPRLTEEERAERQKSLSSLEESLRKRGAPPINGETPPPPSKEASSPSGSSQQFTDTANAERLISRFGSSIRWVSGWSSWLLWDNRRWQLDLSYGIEAFAKQVTKDRWREISKMNVVDPSVANFARYSSNAGGIRNMIYVARSDESITIDHEQLDRDPWLLNCFNGTVNLRTGNLKPHNRENYITKILPMGFVPNAPHPLWSRFLGDIFQEDGELLDYVQKLAGISLSGVVEEHLLLILYGNGGNGKTTFLETLRRLFGKDYGMKAPPSLLMKKSNDSHPTERADLYGKRFVACTETEQGRKLDEALVKELTGGDQIRARRMKENFWEFTPTHQIWLATNHKPKITGTDHGIWRRVKLIPFEATFSGKQEDKKMKEKLAEEMPGILSWAVQGCLKWQREGLETPKVVLEATKEYRVESDEIGQFISEHCELGSGYIEGGGDLYAAFQGAFPETQQTIYSFAARLKQEGFTNKDPATSKECRNRFGKKAWRGIRLKK